METTRTLKDLENRRVLAVERVNQGWSQADVARFLGVDARSVRRWVQAYRLHGWDGLSSLGHPGRPPKLDPEQTTTVLSWFQHSPTEFGYQTDLWTARRVADLITKHFGVSFNSRYLSTWLSNRDITPQRPQRVPRERDQERIDAWVQDEWLELLKKGAPSRRISS
jgi:transposase